MHFQMCDFLPGSTFLEFRESQSSLPLFIACGFSGDLCVQGVSSSVNPSPQQQSKLRYSLTWVVHAKGIRPLGFSGCKQQGRDSSRLLGSVPSPSDAATSESQVHETCPPTAECRLHVLPV